MLKQAQYFAAAKIIRIGELKGGLRRGIAFQKAPDVIFELVSVQVVPEPATAALLGFGSMLVFRRRNA